MKAVPLSWAIFLILLNCKGMISLIGASSHSTDELFRALWIPTIENVLWPSRPGLPTLEQKEELVAILNAAQSIGIGVIFFQVRPAGDAMYKTKFAPGSHYLTGKQHNGELAWDPLDYLIREAVSRGIKVHAWVNLFRISPTHCRNHTYARKSQHFLGMVCHAAGSFNWLDPGAEKVQNHLKDVVFDIISRYDVAGIQVDDVFYPPLADKGDFPDEPSYKQFLSSGGTLSLFEWRRNNAKKIFSLIKQEIKLKKPYLKLTLNTFGLYKMDTHTKLKDENSYAGYYTEEMSPKWPETNSYIGDFLTPQLTWKLHNMEQGYENDTEKQVFDKKAVLSDWRLEESSELRRLFSGNEDVRLLNPNWEVFVLCGKIHCPSSNRYKRDMDTTEETPGTDDLSKEISFRVYREQPDVTAPLVSSDGEHTLPDTPPDLILGSKFNDSWALEDNRTIGVNRTKLYMIVHGYMSNPEESWALSMKDALLKHHEDSYENIVVLTDWSILAKAKWYPTARDRITVVAKEIDRFVSELIDMGKLVSEDVHCLGHSLGAHTCGLASKSLHFGRITGLDPAGPGFQIDRPEGRLDKGDANFVDIIHTDVGRGGANLGMVKPIGHIDFYPNGRAVKQPGCKVPPCSHSRAYEYYTASIAKDCFKVYHKCPDEKARTMPGKCKITTDDQIYTRMGHHVQNYNESSGIFYLKTLRRYPYCSGQCGLKPYLTLPFLVLLFIMWIKKI